VLQALSLTGEVAQGDLGRTLAIDSTTLTRTLAIMSRHGWISTRSGRDRRERRLSLAGAGRAQLEHALPAWTKAQRRAQSQMGQKVWQELLKLTNDVPNLVTN
jgi:DNA-binding MarR family transcriptional regulator